jgi:hypothetical protein
LFRGGGSCRGARRLLVGSALAVALSLNYLPAPAGAATSLAGKWSWAGGTVTVTGSPTSGYTGTSSIVVWKISPGSGPNLAGSVNWNDDQGNPLGLYPATFTLGGSGGAGSSLKICGDGPQGNHQCTSASKASGDGPTQKEVLAAGKKVGKKIGDKLAALLKAKKKANKKKSASNIRRLDDLIVFICGYGPPAQVIVDDWKEQKLPQTPGAARRKFGKPQAGQIFQALQAIIKAGKAYCSFVLANATEIYKTPDGKQKLDAAAQKKYSKTYDQLTGSQQCEVAGPIVEEEQAKAMAKLQGKAIKAAKKAHAAF